MWRVEWEGALSKQARLFVPVFVPIRGERSRGPVFRNAPRGFGPSANLPAWTENLDSSAGRRSIKMIPRLS
jgi:hypothetical protein